MIRELLVLDVARTERGHPIQDKENKEVGRLTEDAGVKANVLEAWNGTLCHETYFAGNDAAAHLASAKKTTAALVMRKRSDAYNDKRVNGLLSQ